MNINTPTFQNVNINRPHIFAIVALNGFSNCLNRIYRDIFKKNGKLCFHKNNNNNILLNLKAPAKGI